MEKEQTFSLETEVWVPWLFIKTKIKTNSWDKFAFVARRLSAHARGPFPQSPENFSGPKSNIQIEIKRIKARVLASKILHFVSLTDSFIMLDAKLLKLLSCM